MFKYWRKPLAFLLVGVVLVVFLSYRSGNNPDSVVGENPTEIVQVDAPPAIVTPDATLDSETEEPAPTTVAGEEESISPTNETDTGEPDTIATIIVNPDDGAPIVNTQSSTITVTEDSTAIIDLILNTPQFDNNITNHINADGTIEVVISLYGTSMTVAGQDTDDIAQARENLLNQPGWSDVTVAYEYDNIPAVAVRMPVTLLEALAQDETVSFVQYDDEISVSVESVQQLLGVTDNSNVRVTTQTGENVVVAVLDAGVDPGYALFDNGGAIIDSACFVDNCNPGQHGTLMAGIIRSIAPDVQLVNVQVLNPDGRGTVGSFLAGLDYILTNQSTLNVDIINLSVSTSTEYAGECDSVYGVASGTIRDLSEMGISIFAASGNNGSRGRMSGPACLDGVTSVAASYADDNQIPSDDVSDLPALCNPEDANYVIPSTAAITCFSNRDWTLDLLAPGTDIVVPGIATDLSSYGTSQATAITSAIAALMLDGNGYLSPAQILTQLRSTGTPVNVDARTGIIQVPRINGIQAITEAENTLFSCALVTDVPQTECSALETFYTELDGENWLNNDGWLQDFAVCDWHGITCNADNRVYRIDLGYNRLSGTIPPSFANLTELGELFLDSNQIRGRVPASVVTALGGEDSNLVSADFGFNAMDVFALPANLETFMNRIDVDFKRTQTVLPNTVYSARLPGNVIVVGWQPIFFVEGSGYFEVGCSTDPANTNFAFSATTADKGETSVQFDSSNGVQANTDYYCRVRTVTEAGGFVPVELVTSYSDPQFASTGAPIPFIPLADTFITSLDGRDNRANNAEQQLFVGSYVDTAAPGDPQYTNSHSLIDFGMSGLPLNVDSAILRLYVYGVNGNPQPISVFPTQYNWDRTVAYNDLPSPDVLVTQPPIATNIVLPACDDPTFALCYTGNGGKRLIEIELDAAGIAALTDPATTGVILRNTTSNNLAGAVFCSSNATLFCPVEFYPTIEITFTQAAGVNNLVPAHESVNVPINTRLNWDSLQDPQGDAVTFNVLAGSSPQTLAPVPGAQGLTSSEYNAFSNAYDMDYGDVVYWRVNVLDAGGNVEQGDIHSFQVTYCSPDGQVPQSECEALVELYEQTGGDSWFNPAPAPELNPVPDPSIPVNPVPGTGTWLNRPVCDWQGVTCENGHVTALNLSGVGLVGSDFSAVNGLTELRLLNLSNNDLSGEIAPLTALSQLEELDLSDNDLRGNLTDLSALQSLRVLRLNGNLLNGSIPASWSALNLEELYLKDNYLTDDPFVVLSDITTLEILDLSENKFTGELTNISQLQNLQQLNLAYNAFGYVIPVELGDLSSLTSLDISYNMLETTDDALATWVESLQFGWETTQTVPPTNLLADTSDNIVNLTWETIAYQGSGYYGYDCLIAPANEFDITEFTVDRTATGAIVDDLYPNETYDCVVVSITPASDNQKNYLVSRPVEIENVESTFTQELGDSLDNPIIIPPDSPYYRYIVETNNSFTGDEEVPECVSDGSGRVYFRRSTGSTGSNEATIIRVTGEGIDGTNVAIAVIAIINGEPTYIECHVSVDETGQSADSPISPDLNSDDVAFDMYLEPGVTYYFVVMNEDGASGSVEFTIQEKTFLGCETAIGVTEIECAALVDFYYSTAGYVLWEHDDNWLISADVCTWYGVTCTGGHVTGLALQNNGLGGEIPASFSDLGYLTMIDLSYNELKGSVPAGFKSLSGLVSADLSYNQLYSIQDSLTEFLNGVDPDWQETQTVAPDVAGMVFSETSPTTLLVTWDPILYAGGEGFYTLGYSPTAGGPYVYVDVPGGKNASSYEVPIAENTEYYFILMTTSTEYLFGQQRTVTSLWSAERRYQLPLILDGPDADGDGIPDVRDACPSQASEDGLGIDETGCPYYDADRDGIYDREDECPSQASEDGLGIDEVGCPYYDADRDGIYDRDDECPSQANEDGLGIDETGCPYYDADRDGIYDRDDECPWEGDEGGSGVDETGCPYYDADGDGVPDRNDACAWRGNEYGYGVDETGCPIEDPDEGVSGTDEPQPDATEEVSLDADGDGLTDTLDACPYRGNEDGLGIDETGCPYYDVDRDGIYNRDDACVQRGNEYGLGVDESGCPIEPQVDGEPYVTQEPGVTEEPQQ